MRGYRPRATAPAGRRPARIFKTSRTAGGRLTVTYPNHHEGVIMPADTALSVVVIDSADPAALAGFYQKLTGLDVTYTDDTYVVLGDGPVKLGFQRVEDYQGPGWPDPAKHSHLDFTVADMEKAAAELVTLGAGQPEFQPGGDSWIVLTDPEGHPFCVTTSG